MNATKREFAAYPKLVCLMILAPSGLRCFFTFLFLFVSLGVFAAPKPQIELGMMGFHGIVPHYVGSNEYYRINFIFPYVVLRNPYIEAGEVNRFFIHNGDNLNLEFGFFGRLPLWNEDAELEAPKGINNPDQKLFRGKSWHRRGMDHQPAILQYGLKTTYFFNQHLYTVLPLYRSTGVVIGMPYKGSTFSPSIRYDFFDRKSPHAVILFYDQTYGDKQNNSLLYSVGSKDVLEGRPEYDAGSGFVSESSGLLANYQVHPKFDLVFSYYTTDLSNSELAKSPLVVTTKNTTWVIGVMYRFYMSKKLIEVHK